MFLLELVNGDWNKNVLGGKFFWEKISQHVQGVSCYVYVALKNTLQEDVIMQQYLIYFGINPISPIKYK